MASAALVLFLGVILHTSRIQCAPQFLGEKHDVVVRQVSSPSTTISPDPCGEFDCVQGTSCFLIPGDLLLCSCPEGYNYLPFTGLCSDTVECVEDPTVCENAHACINLPGSHVCSCMDGWTLEEEKLCVDIDECALELDNCQQVCNNTIGSFECLCHAGLVPQHELFGCPPSDVPVVTPPVASFTMCDKTCVYAEDGVTFGKANKGCGGRDERLLKISNERLTNKFNTYLQGIDIKFSLNMFWYKTECSPPPNAKGNANDPRDGYICSLKG